MTPPCPARLADGPLTCNRPDPHDPGPRGGHTYTATNASHLGEGTHHTQEPTDQP